MAEAGIAEKEGRLSAAKKVSIRHGSKTVDFIISNPSDFIQKRILQGKKFYEYEMLLDAESRLLPGELSVDVGANIGNHTLFFAGVCGSQVVAIEPNPSNASLLTENVKANMQEGLVEVHQVAAGQETGAGTVEVNDPTNTGKARVRQAADGETRVVRLDDLLADRPVAVLKVDVEGMELEVLKGATRILSDYRPVLYVEAGTQLEFGAVQGFLADRGYAMTRRFNATATYLFEPAKDDADRTRILLRSTAAMRNEMRESRLQIEALANEVKQTLLEIRAGLPEPKRPPRKARKETATAKQPSKKTTAPQ